MKKPTIKTIRAAVTKNRGGLAEATDAQLMKLWTSLADDVQKQYLDSVKERKADADRNGSAADD